MKKFERFGLRALRDSGRLLLSSCGWLTNGHWGVRVETLPPKVARHAKSVDSLSTKYPQVVTTELSTSGVERLLTGRDDGETIVRSPLIYCYGENEESEARLYLGGSGKIVWIDRFYADTFDLETARTIRGSESPCWDLSGSAVVMPLRLPDEAVDALRSSARKVLRVKRAERVPE